MEQRLFEALVELSPKPADVDVDDVGAGVEMIVPDLLEKHCPGHDPSLVACKIFEQQIFARLEVELLAAALHASRERVDLEVADRQPVLGRIDTGFAAAEQRIHAREQLSKGEGLHQV